MTTHRTPIAGTTPRPLPTAGGQPARPDREHRRRQRAPWGVQDVPDLTGRTVVVTGANSGLGLETAAVLLGAGADVVLACRNEHKADEARRTLIERTGRRTVTVRALDLADLGSVAAFADGVTADLERLDVLVNNAGLMAIDEARTADGFEMQFGVNHLGHAALTARLLPILTATPGSRVVNVTSMGHRAGRMTFDDPMFERRRYRRWPRTSRASSPTCSSLPSSSGG